MSNQGNSLATFTPVYEPDQPWREFALHEVYQGPGTGKYVPKVRDKVTDMSTGFAYRCESIDFVTMIAKLVPFDQRSHGSSTETDDRLIGPGPRGHEETIRLYVDKSVFPFECAVDEYYTIGAVSAQFARVFVGSVTEANQQVISAVYDQNNNFMGNNIPLELVKLSADQNVATKGVIPFHTSYDLKNNDIVTIVFYAAEGHVVSMRTLAVMESGWIRSTAADHRYIEGLELETPYNSSSEPGVVEFPINLPINAAGMIGVVKYSDGTRKRAAVDGNQFEIFGMGSFGTMGSYIASVANQSKKVTLAYTLSPGESVYNKVQGEERKITESFTFRTRPAEHMWSVRLYCYPVWIDAVSGYRLAWYLYNAQRDSYHRVDSLVHVNGNNPAFRPTAYGVRQRISVTIDLAEVSNAYTTYNHTQVFEIELIAPGTGNPTLWRVGDYNADNMFGDGLFIASEFRNQNLKYLDLTFGETDYNNWLKRIYRNTNPLYISGAETQAPDPTHMFLRADGSNTEVEVSLINWRDTVVWNDLLSPDTTMFARFIRRMGSSYLHLGVAGLPVKQTT